jgi:hypothetical protein
MAKHRNELGKHGMDFGTLDCTAPAQTVPHTAALKQQLSELNGENRTCFLLQSDSLPHVMHHFQTVLDPSHIS